MGLESYFWEASHRSYFGGVLIIWPSERTWQSMLYHKLLQQRLCMDGIGANYFVFVLALQIGKPLFRKTKDGRVFNWNVELDDSFCTLAETFQKVDSHLGFNIELKFDDNIIYSEDHLTHVLQVILRVRRYLFLCMFQFFHVVVMFLLLSLSSIGGFPIRRRQTYHFL